MRKTKIICTLGPACRDEKTLTAMIQNGMNVARLNFSHQDHTFHQENIALLKSLRKRLGVPLGLMLDTKGPEIRTGHLINDHALLVTGSEFMLTVRPITGNASGCFVNCLQLPMWLREGDKILIDDGKIELCVLSCTNEDINCKVVRGGELGNTRGVNIPSADIPMPFLSERDISDLKFGISQGIEIIAASFVRTAQDILDLRAFLDANGGEGIQIMAKIENRSGVEHFEEILSCCDGIMVARGDMGVEVPYELLPGIQKKLITSCFKSGKPAIVATQMLESMITSANPTRAEINDVANAVFDSASAVMLSGETAIGTDPANVVATMARICETAERDAFDLQVYERLGEPCFGEDSTDAICRAATHAAENFSANAILAVTHNGQTARSMAKYRPRAQIIGATDRETVFHQMSLNWGVNPLLTSPQSDTDSLLSHVISAAALKQFIKEGEKAVVTLGSPVGISGKTNTLKLVTV